MKASIAALTAIFALCAVLFSAMPAPAPSLDAVLRNMDSAAAGFKTAQGNITYTKVTVIVDDKAVDQGQFFFERLPSRKGSSELRVRIDFTQTNGKPSERHILLKGTEGQIYYPKARQVEIYDLGKNKDAMESFLLLGFGSTSKDLQKAYTIAMAGETKIDGDDVVQLDLTPKSAATARQIKAVHLFLSKKTWQPVRQVFTQTGGDYSQADYTAVEFSTPLRAKFDLNLPGGVKRIYPQK